MAGRVWCFSKKLFNTHFLLGEFPLRLTPLFESGVAASRSLQADPPKDKKRINHMKKKAYCKHRLAPSFSCNVEHFGYYGLYFHSLAVTSDQSKYATYTFSTVASVSSSTILFLKYYPDTKFPMNIIYLYYKYNFPVLLPFSLPCRYFPLIGAHLLLFWNVDYLLTYKIYC